VIVNSLIENFFSENRMLEERILGCVDEVPLEFFSAWSCNRQEMGEYLTDVACCAIAKKYNSYVIANPVNPTSYAHFIRHDVQSKSFAILARTLRTGIRNGFLESGSNMRPLDFCIQGQKFYAVERTGKERLVKKTVVSDKPLMVSCYEDGSFIVSDVDLVSIFSHEGSDKILFDPTYGELTAHELTMIQELNCYFQELVSNYCASASPSFFKLIAHGAANRFSNSKASHLHYPMKIYTPHSAIKFLSHDFFDFNYKMSVLGYHAYLNPKWGIPK
jgi:hypothetical protein